MRWGMSRGGGVHYVRSWLEVGISDGVGVQIGDWGKRQMMRVSELSCIEKQNKTLHFIKSCWTDRSRKEDIIASSNICKGLDNQCHW